MSVPHLFESEAVRHGSDTVRTIPSAGVNAGGSVPNGNSAATGSTASGLPNYGGLAWQPITLPEKGDTGYIAPDTTGGYYYFGPDQVLYHDPYAGEVHPGDISHNAVGNVGAFFAGSTPAAPSAGASTGPTPFDTLASLLGSMAGQSPAVASAPASTDAQAIPTQNGPDLTLPIILLLLAAGGGYLWWKSHYGGG